MPEIDLPTVIFALVALFVAWKLRSVLGMRQDSDRPGELLAPLRRAPGPASAPVAQPDAPPSAPAPPPCGGSLEGRRRARTPRSGAASTPSPGRIAASRRKASCPARRVAYDMVVHAFAAGNSDALKSLMSPEAFANFESAIHARADAGHTMTTTVVSIDNATIVGAALVGQMARISVRFAAKLASVTRDAQGEVVDGSPNTVVEHIDLWTFARDVRSRDPNWQLTATESES